VQASLQPPELPPSLQERYELREKLGEGGSGVVYSALQKTTGQTVAVKMLRVEGEPHAPQYGKQASRFQREVELCAQLHHPNIVRLLDASRDAADPLYAVFEFVPGRTLAQLLAEEGRM
jgi:serine/threonine protein kinase